MVYISRVQKELTDCNRDREVSGVSIALHDGANISHLTGTIAGPADSTYEGGTFVIDIRLPGGYPFEPPMMQFVTKVCTARTSPIYFEGTLTSAAILVVQSQKQICNKIGASMTNIYHWFSIYRLLIWLVQSGKLLGGFYSWYVHVEAPTPTPRSRREIKSPKKKIKGCIVGISVMQRG